VQRNESSEGVNRQKVVSKAGQWEKTAEAHKIQTVLCQEIRVPWMRSPGMRGILTCAGRWISKIEITGTFCISITSMYSAEFGTYRFLDGRQ
jgi:hypothetical protein